MPKPEWPAAERALLLRLVQDGKSPYQCFEEFQQSGIARSQKAVVRKIQNETAKAPHLWHAMIRPSPVAPLHVHQAVVKADKCLCLFDIHAPFHDPAWLNRLMAIALRRGAEDCIIGGDLIDFSALNHFGRQKGVETEAEVDAAEHVVKMLAATFQRVLLFAGNHELRLPKKLDYLLSLEKTMEDFIVSANVSVSDYQWCELRSGGETYYIEHPKNASVVPVMVPRKLAAKYHQNVVAGHGHLAGMSRDDSNRYWAIDSGVCCDPRKLAYVQKVHNTRPQVMQGAVLVERGIPILLTPQNASLYE